MQAFQEVLKFEGLKGINAGLSLSRGVGNSVGSGPSFTVSAYTTIDVGPAQYRYRTNNTSITVIRLLPTA
jgi:hypothetical protein